MYIYSTLLLEGPHNTHITKIDMGQLTRLILIVRCNFHHFSFFVFSSWKQINFNKLIIDMISTQTFVVQQTAAPLLDDINYSSRFKVH